MNFFKRLVWSALLTIIFIGVALGFAISTESDTVMAEVFAICAVAAAIISTRVR